MNDNSMNQICLTGIFTLPLISDKDDLAKTIPQAFVEASLQVEDNDVIVVAQKIVSKAEGATVKLASIEPSNKAQELAAQTGRDPRLCQVYINESSEILRVKGRMVITKQRLGFKCSGAGVDRSNVAPHNEEIVVLLPTDPDDSARHIRQGFQERFGKKVAVIVSDSFGRDDRDGSVGMAIGIAGIGALEQRQQHDLFGNPSNSRIALIDELAAAASLLMGQADERTPVVLIRGAEFVVEENSKISDILVEG